MVFVSKFVYVVNYIDGFLYIELSLHPWDEAYLIMMDDCFDVFLDSVFENFIEIASRFSLFILILVTGLLSTTFNIFRFT